MPQELPDQLTPVGQTELIRSLWDGWTCCFGTAPPKKECIWVIAAQWALETNWGHSSHCYNLGNVKSSEGDGHDYCFFACNEALPKAEAEAYQAKDPIHAKVTAYRADGTCWIWFYPPHPGCRFRAFHTLLEGAVDQVKILSNRFKAAWPAVLAGDPGMFVHCLKQTGYFTADEESYKKAVMSIYETISKLNIDYDMFPVMSDEQRERINNLVLLTVQDDVDSILTTAVPDEG